MWLEAAPRAAAYEYRRTVNRVLPPDERLSAIALTFDGLSAASLFQLEVLVPTPLAGFSIMQLQIPKDAVTIVRRTDSDNKELDTSHQAKINAGDIIVFSGTAHDLAAIATMGKEGVAVLMKPRQMSDTRDMLAAQKQSLLIAAQELHDRLWLACQRKQPEWRQRKAAQVIQAWQRRARIRRVFMGEMQALRYRQRAARSGARKIGLLLLRGTMSEAMISEKNGLLTIPRLGAIAETATATSTPGLGAIDSLTGSYGGGEKEDEAMEAASRSLDLISEILGCDKLLMARAFVERINRMLLSAPEAAELGAPLSLYTMLFGDHLTVTATLLVNETTIGQVRCARACAHAYVLSRMPAHACYFIRHGRM